MCVCVCVYVCEFVATKWVGLRVHVFFLCFIFWCCWVVVSVLKFFRCCWVAARCCLHFGRCVGAFLCLYFWLCFEFFCVFIFVRCVVPFLHLLLVAVWCLSVPSFLVAVCAVSVPFGFSVQEKCQCVGKGW